MSCLREMSIVNEEFYQILRQLESVRDENRIEDLEPLWNRTVKIGWEGDVVRNAIRDTTALLARRYGINDLHQATYATLLRKREEYLFLHACVYESLGRFTLTKLDQKLLEKGMLRAIRSGNTVNVIWFTHHHFDNTREEHFIAAIESGQLAIAKQLMQSFQVKTVSEAERIAVCAIKAGWYLGCLAMDSRRPLDRAQMALICVEYNQLSCLRFFARKGAKIPREALTLAVERNYPDIVDYLIDSKYMDFESAIIRCLDFPERREMLALLLTRRDKAANALRLLALENARTKLHLLKNALASA